MLVVFVDDDVRAGRNRIIRDRFALLAQDDDLRVQIFLVLDDDHGFLRRGLIEFLLHGDAFDDVDEFHLAALFRENRDVVRIPFDDRIALLDLAGVLDRDDGTDDEIVRLEFAPAVFGHDRQGAVLVQNDVAAVFQFDEAQIVVLNHAVELGFDFRLLEHLRGRSTDVECAHRQLCSRLADGLCRDDADGFAALDHAASREVAAVAAAADAQFAFAREHGTNANLFHAGDFHLLGFGFVNEFVGVDDDLLDVAGINDVVAREAADKALAQFHDFVFALVNGLHQNAVAGSAIFHADDHVLGHVHEFAGHVTGVGGLERGIRQTFAGAVGRDEVFQHGQTFAEVRQNRFFDNVAAGLGHQTADTSQLANLLTVASSAGIHHQRDGVVFRLALVGFQCAQHDVRNLVGAMRPDVDDFVVAFARGDDTFAILLFNFAESVSGRCEFPDLFPSG